ncbi:RAB21-like protein, partial [Mya arenaria]
MKSLEAKVVVLGSQVDDYRVKLQVWDTAGQERFRSMAPMYYRKANAAMLIYDITSSDTFYDIKDWVSVLCLVGNKCDLVDSRQVNVTDAQEYADSIGALFFETSALKNTGIEEAFLEASKRLIKLYETTPTSGLHTLDQLNSSGNNDDKIHIDPPSKHTGPPPPPASNQPGSASLVSPPLTAAIHPPPMSVISPPPALATNVCYTPATNGCYTPAANGCYTPATNGCYTPATNGCYTPATNGCYTPATNGCYTPATNVCYQSAASTTTSVDPRDKSSPGQGRVDQQDL